MTNPFYVDLRSLALVRVCLALVVLLDLLIRSCDLSTWLTDAGVLPLEHIVPRTSEWRFSLYFLSGSFGWATLLTAVQALAALCMLIGYRTRMATLVLLALLISLHNRAPILLQGGDNLLLLMVFWSVFLPMGARWSLDASVTRAPMADNRYLSISSAAILLQAMAVYFFSAFLKSDPAWLPDGTAIYYALNLEQFSTPVGALWKDALWLSRPLTYYVWWLELIGPLLMFSPWLNTRFRLLMVLAFVSLEIGFIVNLRIGLFWLVSISSILLFLPSAFWDRVAQIWRARGKPLALFYDEHCAFCEKSCHILRTMLLLPDARITTAQSDKEANALMDAHFSWVVRSPTGDAIESSAMATLLHHSPLLFWAAPIVRWGQRPADALYRWVAKHRGGFGRLFAALLPWREQANAPGRASQVTAFVALIALGWWNIATVSGLPYPAALANAKDALRLDQIWNMFAPLPKQDDGWFVLPGVLEDGTEVNALNGDRGAPTFAKPEPLYTTQFSNYRWRKYMTRLYQRVHQNDRQPYGRWLCRNWNAHAPEGQRLQAWDMYYIEELTLPPGQGVRVTPIHLWRHRCLPGNHAAAFSTLNALAPPGSP